MLMYTDFATKAEYRSKQTQKSRVIVSALAVFIAAGLVLAGPNTALAAGSACSPGFWKNHSSAWQKTGYSQSQTLEAVFNVPDSFGVDSKTLAEALKFSGGSGDSGMARTLLRAAVAGLLNAGHTDLDYPLSTADVIAKVNTALTQNRSAMETLKNTLDKNNNSSCNLGSSKSKSDDDDKDDDDDDDKKKTKDTPKVKSNDDKKKVAGKTTSKDDDDDKKSTKKPETKTSPAPKHQPDVGGAADELPRTGLPVAVVLVSVLSAMTFGKRLF
jgi:hypothetical protein